MPSMTKRVNIRATVSIRTVTPPISAGTLNNVIMSTGDIFKCIVRRAIVDEILPDGSLVRLNSSNYFLDNGAGLDAYNPKTVEKAPTVEPTTVPPVINEEEVNATVISAADLSTPVEEETAHEEVVEPEAEPATDEVVDDLKETAPEAIPHQQQGGHKKKNRH